MATSSLVPQIQGSNERHGTTTHLPGRGWMSQEGFGTKSQRENMGVVRDVRA